MWARVSATYLYPIKAGAPLPVPALTFDPAGDIPGDRRWVVVDGDNRLTWQGAIPTLARLIPSGTPDQLALASSDGQSVAFPSPAQCQPRTIFAWNGSRQAFDELAGHDAGDAVAGFASGIAGQSIRLVHLATTAHLPNAVHLITDSSLAALAAELNRDTNLLRFRPNLVLTGENGSALPPFIEEQFAAVVFSSASGALRLAVTGPCERCAVINVDPASSEVDTHYLKTVVAQSRTRRTSASPMFGVYARATTAGTLPLGARVELVMTAR